MAKKGDFVYADPPYAIQNRRIFNQYGPTTFGLNDLSDLAKHLHGLDDKGVKFLVSYAYSRESLDIFSDWDIKAATVQRTVAGNPLKRRRVREMFVTNIER
jgi:DNA adenine methylase